MAKFTAARPKTGGAASCQHSRREALLAADMAVMLKLVARLATLPMRASMQAVLIEGSLIVTLQASSVNERGRDKVDYLGG
jgi:hypothetical protein